MLHNFTVKFTDIFAEDPCPTNYNASSHPQLLIDASYTIYTTTATKAVGHCSIRYQRERRETNQHSYVDWRQPFFATNMNGQCVTAPLVSANIFSTSVALAIPLIRMRGLVRSTTDIHESSYPILFPNDTWKTIRAIK